ncbi:unnamed protein product [Urochloa humidicola]
MASSTKTARLLTILQITLLLVVLVVIMSGSLCHGARVGADGSSISTGGGASVGGRFGPGPPRN